MKDLEKELGPLIENFQNLLKTARAKKLDSLREDEDLENEFNKLSMDVIEPVMRKFVSYLKSKDVNSSVDVQSQIADGKDPNIQFNLHFKLSLASRYPILNFHLTVRKYQFKKTA